MIRRIPLSFVHFGLMGLVYGTELLLAQSWLGGLISILILMPFWSILIINGALVAIAVETLARKLSKLWLIFPIGWFGFVAVQAAHDQMGLASLRRDVAAINARAHLPFVPNRDALVLGSGIRPEDVLARLDVPFVLTASKDPVNEPPYVAYRIAAADFCFDQTRTNLRLAAGFERQGYVAMPLPSPPGTYCLIALPSPAPERSVAIARLPVRQPPGQTPTSEIVRLVAVRSDGPRAEVRSGTAQIMPWLPIPKVGCMRRNLMKDEVTCVHELERWPEKLSPSTDLDLLAAALALPGSPSGAAVQNAPAMWRLVGAAAQLRQGWQTRRLDTVLAHPDDPVPLAVPSLEGEAAIIQPRMAAILALAARTVGEDNPRHDRACEAYALALSLGSKALKALQPQLRRLAAADDCFGWNYEIKTDENLRPDPEEEAAAEDAEHAAEVARARRAERSDAAPASHPVTRQLYNGPLAAPRARPQALRQP